MREKPVVVKRMELARRLVSGELSETAWGDSLTYDALVYKLTESQIEELYAGLHSAKSGSLKSTESGADIALPKRDASEMKAFNDLGRSLMYEVKAELNNNFVNLTANSYRAYFREGCQREGALFRFVTLSKDEGGTIPLPVRVTKGEKKSYDCTKFRVMPKEDAYLLTSVGSKYLLKLLQAMGADKGDLIAREDCNTFAILSLFARESFSRAFWGGGLDGEGTRLNSTTSVKHGLLNPRPDGNTFARVIEARGLYPFVLKGSGEGAAYHINSLYLYEPELLPASSVFSKGKHRHLAGMVLAVPIADAGVKHSNMQAESVKKCFKRRDMQSAEWLSSWSAPWTEQYIVVTPLSVAEVKNFCSLRGFDKTTQMDGFATYGDLYKALCTIEEHKSAFLSVVRDLTENKGMLIL